MSPKSIWELDFTPCGAVNPSPSDWRDHVFYHLLIDRFDNNCSGLEPFDDKAMVSAEWEPQNTRRLDYIRGLGCTAIWVSPPFKNRQHSKEVYNGYAIQNFLAIDPRFGTLEDLQELIRQAHERKMYVSLDVVINHTGDNWG